MSVADLHDREQAAWRVLDDVLDPEVPVLSVRDLGIVRAVESLEEGMRVVLTPTYSGCPATEVICDSVRQALESAGFGPVTVSLQRAPAWTTEWMSDEGRRKLREYGIAPPGAVQPPGPTPMTFFPRRPLAAAPEVLNCPRCGSAHTERLSAFGSTACKSMHRCLTCREPFEHFKPL
ncbi:MAG: hypothetical protein RI949_2602 [Pseudomonadota bacterium]|jgi:ring-1,2-phenylacetyl-CoA epoxidase subunit PaaD